MAKLDEKRPEIIDILNIVILLDLFFGGSGRLIMVGSFSLRLILFAIAMVYTIAYVVIKNESLEGRSFSLIAALVLYLALNVVFVGEESLPVKFDFFSRYLYVVLVFFYEIYFAKHGTEKSIEDMRKMIEVMTFIFALFSIGLWLYAYSIGPKGFLVIENGFFRPKVYGVFDLIGGKIPRIFMKSSIFLPIGFLFEADRFINGPGPVRFIKCVIYAIAIGTTLTAGFFLATAICSVLLLHRERALAKGIGYFILMLLVIGALLAVRIGLLDVIMQKFSGDYTTSFRATQMMSIINEWLKKPVFGNGFGYEYTTMYGATARTTSSFEIAWGETLVDTGIVGFFLFVSVIGYTFFTLLRLSEKSITLYLFALSLLFICLESCTNPFINNSIGLTFFAICAGITNAIVRGRIDIKPEDTL